MEENFSLLAQSRANYYTPGSPVQFVRVELLRGDESGQIVICLTFKNVGTETVEGLSIRFKCKNRQGQIVYEDKFAYEELKARQGDLFGADDAVYVSDEPIGSVDVELDRVTLAGGRQVDLSSFKRTRLPGLRPLPTELSKALCQRTGKEGMNYVPQVIEQGWYCACGAFHPKAENTVYCSECGSDRILLQNALSGMLQKAKAEAEADAIKEAEASGTRILNGAVPAAEKAEEMPKVDEPTTMYAAPETEEKDDGTRVYNGGSRHDASAPRPVEEEPYEDEEYEEEYEEQEDELSPDDALAANIIRWAPPVTVILCALVIAFTVVYHLVLQ